MTRDEILAVLVEALPDHRELIPDDLAAVADDLADLAARTRWGTEHENPEVLRAELEACRQEIGRLRHRNELLETVASTAARVPDPPAELAAALFALPERTLT